MDKISSKIMSMDESSKTDLSINDEVYDTLNIITKHEIISKDQTYDGYYRSVKQTKPFLTKYERTKLIGVRAQMIANGALTLVNVPKNVTDTLTIAELELKEKKIPLLIRRYMPDGTHEDWRLEDLVVN